MLHCAEDSTHTAIVLTLRFNAKGLGFGDLLVQGLGFWLLSNDPSGPNSGTPAFEVVRENRGMHHAILLVVTSNDKKGFPQVPKNPVQ